MYQASILPKGKRTVNNNSIRKYLDMQYSLGKIMKINLEIRKLLGFEELKLLS